LASMIGTAIVTTDLCVIGVMSALAFVAV